MPGGAAAPAEEPTRARPGKPAGMWIPLLPVGGVRVYLDPVIAVVFAYLVFHSTPEHALWVPGTILLGSVLLHELAHAWMARRRGLAVSGIFLHLVPFAYVERGKPQDELRVALAGPALNLVIAGVLFALPAVHGAFPWLDLHAWFDEPLWAAFAINALMGVFNLVPALPADGGRALRAGLMTKLAPASAYGLTARVGTFVGAGCFFFVLLLWPSSDALILGALGGFFILTAWREARIGQTERARERAKARAEREAADAHVD